MTPKRRAINLSWFFICLCVSKSLLIKYQKTVTKYQIFGQVIDRVAKKSQILVINGVRGAEWSAMKT